MAAEEESKKISYPLDPDSYKLVQEIGGGVSAVVYKANCLPMNPAVVAIKDINLERSNANLDDVCREAKAMALLSHPNILSAHCSFTVDRHLWVVMPFMAAGSLLSISKSYPEGLSEQLIAVLLKEALQALGYLHDQGHFHRDIKASNILVNSDGSVKLADFRVSASIYEPSSSLSGDSFLKDVAGTLYWMAPEVIPCGYGIKADIWSFGVTALELAHGRPPLTHLPLSKSLLMRITNRFKFSSYYGNKSEKKFFSKNFKDMVVTCLTQDPSKRPSAEEVLEHPFFKNCSKSPDYLVKNVLQSFPIPVAEERNPVEEEGFDGSPSPSLPSSPLEHQRICGWKFNEEILEFDPVFLTDECVQFGGESINTGKNEEKSDTTTMTHTDSSPPISVTCLDEVSRNTAEEEDTIKKCEEVTREEKSSATHGNLNIVSHLLNLLNSLDYQIEQLIKLLKSCGVEVGPRNQEQQLLQTINDLNLQLLQEKRKVSDLEEELDALKRSMRTAPR